MKRRLPFVILVIVVTAITTYQQHRRRPVASLDEQASQQATAYWDRFIAKCGTRYFFQDGVSRQIIELQNYRVETSGAARTSAADRLNGFEWSGTTHLLPQLTRIRSDNGSWGKWFDGWPFGEMGSNASIMKNKGQWSFNNPYGPTTKPACEMILGSGNPAGAANSISIPMLGYTTAHWNEYGARLQRYRSKR